MFLKFEKFTTIYLSISHSRYEKRVKSRSRQKRVKSDLKWPSRCKNGLGRFAKIFPPSRIFYRSGGEGPQIREISPPSHSLNGIALNNSTSHYDISCIHNI